VSSDLAEKFERPFGPLIHAGVRFYAALVNHDKKANRRYPLLGMDGQRYYTFAKNDVRFFVLDTNRLDRAQLAWIEEALRTTKDSWKICAFHHPLYSDGVKHVSCRRGLKMQRASRARARRRRRVPSHIASSTTGLCRTHGEVREGFPLSLAEISHRALPTHPERRCRSPPPVLGRFMRAPVAWRPLTIRRPADS
jgi:hypothetical protein